MPFVLMCHMCYSSGMDTATAWAAGAFEARGSIDLSSGRPRLIFKSRDRDFVERFRDWAGVGTIRPDAAPATEPFVWTMGKREEVVRILVALRPYFGERRGAKADHALAYLMLRYPPPRPAQ